jgi:hypothetical protein
MNLEKKIAVSLYEIKRSIEKGSSEEAMISLNILWEVVGRIGRNKEIISISGANEIEAVKRAEIENKSILSSPLMLHQIQIFK